MCEVQERVHDEVEMDLRRVASAGSRVTCCSGGSSWRSRSSTVRAMSSAAGASVVVDLDGDGGPIDAGDAADIADRLSDLGEAGECHTVAAFDLGRLGQLVDAFRQTFEPADQVLARRQDRVDDHLAGRAAGCGRRPGFAQHLAGGTRLLDGNLEAVGGVPRQTSQRQPETVGERQQRLALGQRGGDLGALRMVAGSAGAAETAGVRDRSMNYDNTFRNEFRKPRISV